MDREEFTKRLKEKTRKIEEIAILETVQLDSNMRLIKQKAYHEGFEDGMSLMQEVGNKLIK